MRSRRMIVVGSVVATVLAVVGLVYLLAWRPSDDAYVEAVSNIAELQDAIAEVNDTLPRVLDASAVSSTDLSAFQTRVSKVKTAMASLSRSPVASRDFKLTSDFPKYREDIDNYVKSVTDIAKSVGFYLKVVEECGSSKLQTQTFSNSSSKNDFESSIKGCVEALDGSKASPSPKYNTVFLNGYIANVKKLVEALRADVGSTDKNSTKAAILVATEAINDMDANVSVDVKDPSTALSELTSVINTRKSLLIR